MTSKVNCAPGWEGNKIWPERISGAEALRQEQLLSSTDVVPRSDRSFCSKTCTSEDYNQCFLHPLKVLELSKVN
jgi:hypothetical protein